jgi:hypothetical protein
MQTTYGTPQPISGTSLVRCSPSITLSSVLYVSSFSVNLLSVSYLIDQLNYTVFLTKMCVFQERKIWRKIGIEVRCDGIWYVDREVVMLVATMNEGYEEVML